MTRPTVLLLLSEISKTLDGVLLTTYVSQSRLVLVSTSISLSLDIQQIFLVSVSLCIVSCKFPSFDESQSRQPGHFLVSMSLGLDIQQISSLATSLT